MSTTKTHTGLDANATLKTLPNIFSSTFQVFPTVQSGIKRLGLCLDFLFSVSIHNQTTCTGSKEPQSKNRQGVLYSQPERLNRKALHNLTADQNAKRLQLASKILPDNSCLFSPAYKALSWSFKDHNIQ